jgi:hypothetical protein
MKNFPSKLKVENKVSFEQLNYDRNKCYLRRDIYEHVISHEEKDYFSLDDFNRKINDIVTVRKMVEELIPELEVLGWKCKLAFGGTGLFIYSTDTPPANCWAEDGTLY